MKIGKRKKRTDKKMNKVFKGVTLFLLTLMTLGSLPLMSEAKSEDGQNIPGRPKTEISEHDDKTPSYPPTPAGVDDTLVNVKDAFSFPGIEDVTNGTGTPGYIDGDSLAVTGIDVNPNTAAGKVNYDLANWAHLSTERSNLVMMNKWTWIKNQQGQGLMNGNSRVGYGLQKSMVWYNAPLNLTKDFEFEYYVHLSLATTRNDERYGVGDGIVFVMQNDRREMEVPGGYGGGLGVYPSTATGDMIYNAATIEFDTYYNDQGEQTFDKEFGAITWPHVAVAKVKPNTDTYGPLAVAQAHANANQGMHVLSTVTQPANQLEQHAWFGRSAVWGDTNQIANGGTGTWLKVLVKWTPENDQGTAENGVLGYQVSVPDYGLTYPWKETTLNIEDTFNNVNKNEDGTTIPFDKKVYWGFTTASYYSGNNFGVMFSKLPQQPVPEVTRKVKNITQDGETGQYKRNNQADVGDVLEYQVTVTNGRTAESELSLFNTNIVDELDNGSGDKNVYVPNSFKFQSNGKVVDGTSGANPVATINEDGDLTFEDSEHEYVQGASFTYTYRVTVKGNPNIGFENDVHVRSRYSEEVNSTTGSANFQGIVNVAVNGKDLTLTKTPAVVERKKVGDTIDYKLEASVTDGLFVTDSIKDTLPAGMEVVPDTTYISRAGDAAKTKLTDSAVWSNNNLSIEFTGNDRMKLDALGTNPNIIVEYQVRLTEEAKGKTLENQAVISGTNNYIADYEADQKLVRSAPASAKVTVDTELEIEFQDYDGNKLDKSFIESSNSSFHNQNPAKIYMEPGTAYDYDTDYANTVAAISANILAKHQLTEVDVTGDKTSAGIPESGGKIIVKYSAKSSLTVRFVTDAVPEVKLRDDIVMEYDVNTPVDLTKLENVKNAITEIEARQYVLEASGRPTNETSVVIEPKGTVVTYIFKGTLSLTSAPSTIDFGTHNTGSYGKFEASKPKYDNSLIVNDNRTTATKWKLTATVTEVMSTVVDNQTYTLPEALVYKRDNTEEVLALNQARVIYQQDNPQAGVFDVSEEEWKNKDNGFEMKLSATEFRQMSDYTATILFTVSETY